MAALLAVVGAVAIGCAGPQPDGVRLTALRKADGRVTAQQETYFNESHPQFSEQREEALLAEGDTIRAASLDQLPDGISWAQIQDALPDAIGSRLSYDTVNGVLMWDGGMGTVERDELLTISRDIPWERAIYRLSQEREDVFEDGAVYSHEYNVLKLPPSTFPAPDDIMLALPESFQQIGFFEHGLGAPSEEEAFSYFYSDERFREALVVTVDGATTIWVLPNFNRAEMSEDQYMDMIQKYRRCAQVFIQIQLQFRPPTLSEGGRGLFNEERRRTQQNAEETQREARAIEARNRAAGANRE